MYVLYVLIAVLFAALCVFIFLIFPGKKINSFPKLIAHRGLHNKLISENSISAFLNAVRNGYAVENDIHLLKDGEVVVFHDDNTKRMCGVDKRIEDMTLAQVKQLRLNGTDETIPTLKECLDAVDGRVPLLIEFKCLDKATAYKLSEKANDILKDYNGEYYVQSFIPFVLKWYKKNQPHIVRGQLASGFYKENIIKELLGTLIFNFMARPNFISYDMLCKGNVFKKLCCKILGAYSVGWTFHSMNDIDACKNDFSSFIFEDFIPNEKVDS